MSNILLIEDDISYSRIITNFLEKNGFKVQSSKNVHQANTILKSDWAHLVITDYRLPDGNGMQILENVVKLQLGLPVIFITNYSDVRIAVKALKLGAFEYITKPINPDELLETVKEALNEKQEIHKQQTNVDAPKLPEYIIGSGKDSLQMEEHIRIVAPTDLSVLILGETGTGKEFIARRIHQQSNRKEGPFVAIDCGAIPPDIAGSELFGHVKGSFTGALQDKTGYFEFANGGTIFLDEIGNLQYEIQVQLLRAIQERKVRKIGSNQEAPIDIRIIAATNEDLKNQTSDGKFREDLYHRLNEFYLHVQPLRQRQDDLSAFTDFFIQQSNQKLNKSIVGIDDDVKALFMDYNWPGNLRELKNIIRRAVLLSRTEWITREVLPEDLLSEIQTLSGQDDTSDYRQERHRQEKEIIEKVLQEAKYNKSKAAKLLGIDRKTLYNKMEKYGIL